MAKHTSRGTKPDASRREKFITAYIRTASITDAAKAAGYSYGHAVALMNNPDIISGIGAHKAVTESRVFTLRLESGQATYMALNDLARRTTAWATAILEDPTVEIRDKATALETARRTLETVGRAEGIFIERVKNEGLDQFNANLQRLLAAYTAKKPATAERLAVVVEAGSGSGVVPAGRPEPAVESTEQVIEAVPVHSGTLQDAAQLPKPLNGNGNGHASP